MKLRHPKIEDRIIEAIRRNEGIRVKDLVRMLNMWDGNLRREVGTLVRKGVLEKFIKDDFVCVRFRKEK